MEAFVQLQNWSSSLGKRFDYLAPAPAAAALCYPFLLGAFHAIVGSQAATLKQLRNAYASTLEAMRSYLKEVNVSERRADDMLKTEPESVQFLTNVDLRGCGLLGVDPAEQRRRAAENKAWDIGEANKLGLDRREYTRRKALGDQICAYTVDGGRATYSEYAKCKQSILRTGRR